jgi:DHA2 family multidrug resistance protein
MFSIPFCFIAITNPAYVGLPKEASNQVAGIVNFVRNVGGSIFIAVTGAIVTNRSLFHQSRLQEAMQPGNPAFVNQVNALTSFFGGAGKGPGPGLMAARSNLSATQSTGNRRGISGHLPPA